MLLAALLLSGPQNAGAAQARAPEKVYRLALCGIYPDAHPVVEKLILPWAENIARKSKNRLIITYYGPNIMVPEESHHEAMRRGIIAMAQQSAAVRLDQLPVTAFLSVPGGLSSSQSASAALWRMYKNSPELRKEYENLKLITLYAAPPAQLHLTIRTDEPHNLKGIRILCQDEYMAAVLRNLGAIPLILPAGSHYEALLQKRAEGTALPFDMAVRYGLENFPFVQSVCLDINATPCWLAMNKSVWDALPRDLQHIIDSESGEKFGIKIATTLDAASASGKALMAARGVHIKELGKNEKSAQLELIAPDAQKLWIARAKAVRLPEPEKFLERAARFYKASEAGHR